MEIRAVVFDLFGTLVTGLSRDEYRELLADLSAILGAPADAFVAEWAATFEDRCLGRMGHADGAIGGVCSRMGFQPTPDALDAAVALRRRSSQGAMCPRPDAMAVLGTLRARGLRLALCSDATSEIPELWTQGPIAHYFGAAVFSCAEGIKKPDPRMFRLAAERIGVEPQECIYVGDGGSRELTGAATVGMLPVLIRVPTDPAAYRVDAEEDWQGLCVDSLTGVLDILDGAPR